MATITELFTNQGTTTVTSGGTTAPAGGTSESWTVASSSTFPAAITNISQFHVCDTAAGKTSEIITVTNVSGTTWTVTRGAESTTPVAHTAGFTIQQVATSGFLNTAAPVDWITVTHSPYLADPTGTNDSTTAIQTVLNALNTAGGGVAYFPAGTYKISSALSIAGHNVSLIGAGAGDNFSANLTVISQTSTSANGLTCTDADNINISGIAFSGPGSGTGKGIALNYSSPPTQFSSLTDVFVGSFGGDGIYFQEPILTTLTRVWSASNGGWGFNIQGNGTSVSANSCWARSNSGGGWLVTGNYHSFSGCAADINTGVGWELNGCQSVSISGCGSEANTGNAFWITNSSFAITINGLWTSNHAIGLLIDASCFRIMVAGFIETALSGATHSIQVGAGGIATLIQPQVASSVNYAAGGSAFVVQLLDNGITTGGIVDCASLAVQEGSNAKQGTAALTAGSVVVSNTNVTANSRIFLTAQSPGGAVGTLYIHGRSAGTSFTVYSTSGTDTSTFAYEIFEPG